MEVAAVRGYEVSKFNIDLIFQGENRLVQMFHNALGNHIKVHSAERHLYDTVTSCELGQLCRLFGRCFQHRIGLRVHRTIYQIHWIGLCSSSDAATPNAILPKKMLFTTISSSTMMASSRFIFPSSFHARTCERAQASWFQFPMARESRFALFSIFKRVVGWAI